jgi:hypothetical protein
MFADAMCHFIEGHKRLLMIVQVLTLNVARLLATALYKISFNYDSSNRSRFGDFTNTLGAPLASITLAASSIDTD